MTETTDYRTESYDYRVELDRIVDEFGVWGTLERIAEICGERATEAHTANDAETARKWGKRQGLLESVIPDPNKD